MITSIANKIKAGYSALALSSYEEARVEGDIATVAKQLGFGLHAWSITKGVVDCKSGMATEGTDDPLKALDHFEKLDEKSILLMRDFHTFTGMDNPMLIRRIKECIVTGRNSNRVLMVLGCQIKLAPELEKEFTVIEVKLPDRTQLLAVAETIAKSAGIELNGGTEALLDAASGLTTLEAADAMSLAAVESGGKDLPPEVVAREKAATVKKNGILEIVERRVSMEDIGGLEELKKDLHAKRNLFTKEAQDYGLDTPRGILVCGAAGTGKSLTAAATRSIFNLPLVRIEAGRIFGGTVGESEGNWRSAFATVKAISPVICWIDEADSLFTGAESSGKSDGGTTSRVIKAVLQDMQFNGAGIFFVFTANDIDAFPDPLIDRLDVWSVDLPNQTERTAIWSIHISKRKRKPSKFGVPALAEASEGFSGRQIEQVWLKAMTIAFNDGGREPKAEDVIECLKATVPTSKLMADQIEKRRIRLQNRAQPASAKEKVAVTAAGRKLVA